MHHLPIKAIFFDLGGVILTNGWDHQLRQKTADTFNIEWDEFSTRHSLFFDLCELGKISFEEYLKQTIFYTKRPFTSEEITDYIKKAAHAKQDMIDFIYEVKKNYKVPIIALSNEGRELAIDRIERFHLRNFIDFFVISAFVGLKKPDPAIYHLAIDLAQVPAHQILYIDDRSALIDAGKEIGLQAIYHANPSATQMTIESFLYPYQGAPK